ncbi:MAG: type II CAAX endopeptidase family protein, partial [Planctomycetota bacterium]
MILAQIGTPDRLPEVGGFDDRSFGAIESLMALISMGIIAAFLASLWSWITLFRQRRTLFGDRPLVPLTQRAIPFWSILDFLVFFGVLLVGTNLLAGLFLALGWVDVPAVVTDSETADSPVSEPAETLSAAQLAMSSLGTIIAMVATLGLFRIRNQVDHLWHRLGLVVTSPLLGLGLRSAILILPPTMLLMAAASAVQEYSHPVLETLEAEGTENAANYGLFAMMFVSTALVAPIVEEFWFRGLLQGGLQKYADRWQRDLDANGDAKVESSDTVESPVVPEPQSATETSRRVELTGDGESITEDTSSNPYEPSLVPDSSAPPTLGSTAWRPKAYWPILVSSVVFALAHWGHGLAPIPLFFMSLGLGYLVRQTGSLI